jgi:hypothetical protein
MKMEACLDSLSTVDTLLALRSVKGGIRDDLIILQGVLLSEQKILRQRQERMLCTNMNKARAWGAQMRRQQI